MIRTLVLVAASVLFAGGANASTVTARIASAPISRHGGWVVKNPSRMHRWLYVSGGANDYAVVAYDLSAPGMPLVETITQGISYPGGLSISRDGTLYVAINGGSEPGVYAYPWGQTSPSVVYPIANPNVAAVSKEGDLYVATRDTPPSILIYRRGHTTPSRTVTSSLLEVPAQIIFDDAGNAYVADNHTGVLFMAHGTFQVQSLGLEDLDGCTTGLAIDPNLSALFVSDCGGGTQEYILGNPYPVENLDESFPADNLSIGRVDQHHMTLFAPSLFTGQVVFYQARSTTPYATLQTSLSEALGVLYKPAGIPVNAPTP